MNPMKKRGRDLVMLKNFGSKQPHTLQWKLSMLSLNQTRKNLVFKYSLCNFKGIYLQEIMIENKLDGGTSKLILTIATQSNVNDRWGINELMCMINTGKRKVGL